MALVEPQYLCCIITAWSHSNSEKCRNKSIGYLNTFLDYQNSYRKWTYKNVHFKRWLYWVHLLFCICILLYAKALYTKKLFFFFLPHALLLYAYVHVDVCACHYISVQLFLDVAAKSVLFLQLGTFTNSKTVVSFYDFPTICQNSVNYWKNNYNKLLLFVCLNWNF